MFRSSSNNKSDNKSDNREVQPPMPVRSSGSGEKVPAAQTTTGHGGTTQIARGAEIKGEIRTSGSVVVDGRIEGQVIASGDVQIGASGKVEAEVEGQNVTVAGMVKGRIYADGKVMLISGSHVEGDIHAQSLKIDDSVFFQGGCVMGEEARKKRDASGLPKSVLQATGNDSSESRMKKAA